MSERDRDRSIEDLLRQHRGISADPASLDACLDADVLAAWLDGGLSPDEAAAAEAHASGCARCQALLAAAVRTEPARPVAGSRWSFIPALRWAVPLTAAAAAVAIWIAVAPREPMQAPVPNPVAERAPQATATEAAPTPPQVAPQPPEAARHAENSRPAGAAAKDRQEAAFAGRAKKELADRGAAATDAAKQTIDSVSA
jgi:hypothetical protein